VTVASSAISAHTATISQRSSSESRRTHSSASAAKLATRLTPVTAWPSGDMPTSSTKRWGSRLWAPVTSQVSAHTRTTTASTLAVIAGSRDGARAASGAATFLRHA
jgi:hypothetical protein